MALRPYPKIKVLAKVSVTIPEADLELGLGWKNAADAKLEAAEWLRELDTGALPEKITVRVTIKQRSEDVPFTDRGTFLGENDKEFALEYGAAFLENFKTWGRGR